MRMNKLAASSLGKLLSMPSNQRLATLAVINAFRLHRETFGSSREMLAQHGYFTLTEADYLLTCLTLDQLAAMSHG